MFLADLAGCPTPVRLTPGSHAALPAAPRRRAQPCPGWPSGGEPATGKRNLCVSGPSHAGADRDGQGRDHAGGPRTCHSHGNPTPDAYRCIAGRRKEPRPIVGLPAAVPLAREADRLAVTAGPGNRHNTRAMRRSFGTGSQRCSRFTAKRMNTVHPDAVRVSSLPPTLGRTMHVGQRWNVSSTRTARNARAGTSARRLHPTHRMRSQRDATTRPAIAGRSHVDAAPVTAASAPQARALRGGGQIVGLTLSRGGGRVPLSEAGRDESSPVWTENRSNVATTDRWTARALVSATLVGRELVPETESSR
jgi:hypothetical protein